MGTSNAWWPSEAWDDLVAGKGCPLCAALASPENDGDALVVADMGAGRLRLLRNQFVRGYCVLVCRRHVREAHELPVELHTAFFADLVRASKALEAVFQPIKMNFMILGNQVPHLHVHLIPRYADDGAPGAPRSPNDGERFLTEPELQARLAAIQAALAGARDTGSLRP